MPLVMQPPSFFSTKLTKVLLLLLILAPLHCHALESMRVKNGGINICIEAESGTEARKLALQRSKQISLLQALNKFNPDLTITDIKNLKPSEIDDTIAYYEIDKEVIRDFSYSGEFSYTFDYQKLKDCNIIPDNCKVLVVPLLNLEGEDRLWNNYWFYQWQSSLATTQDGYLLLPENLENVISLSPANFQQKNYDLFLELVSRYKVDEIWLIHLSGSKVTLTKLISGYQTNFIIDEEASSSLNIQSVAEQIKPMPFELKEEPSTQKFFLLFSSLEQWHKLKKTLPHPIVRYITSNYLIVEVKWPRSSRELATKLLAGTKVTEVGHNKFIISK